MAYVQTLSHQEPGSLWETPGLDGSVETQPLTTAPIGDFFPHFLTAELHAPCSNRALVTSQMACDPDQVTSRNSTSGSGRTIGALWTNVLRFPITNSTLHYGEMPTFLGVNGLEDPAAVPINSLDEWRTDATIESYSQDRSGPPELPLETDIRVPLDETYLAPPYTSVAV